MLYLFPSWQCIQPTFFFFLFRSGNRQWYCQKVSGCDYYLASRTASSTWLIHNIILTPNYHSDLHWSQPGEKKLTGGNNWQPKMAPSTTWNPAAMVRLWAGGARGTQTWCCFYRANAKRTDYKYRIFNDTWWQTVTVTDTEWLNNISTQACIRIQSCAADRFLYDTLYPKPTSTHFLHAQQDEKIELFVCSDGNTDFQMVFCVHIRVNPSVMHAEGFCIASSDCKIALACFNRTPELYLEAQRSR